MLSPSLTPFPRDARVPVTGERLRRWQRAAMALAPMGAFLAIAWTVLEVPYALLDGQQGWRFIAAVVSNAIITVPLLIALVALVDALDVRRDYRSLAIAGLALLAAAAGAAINICLHVVLTVWPAPLGRFQSCGGRTWD